MARTTNNNNLKELLKKIENDLMIDDLPADLIIAKAKVLEVILKEIKWENL